VGVYLSRFLRPAAGAQPAQDVTYLRIAYAGTVGAPDASRALDTPIVRTLWLTLDELCDSVARHRSPLVLRCVEDHARGQQQARCMAGQHRNRGEVRNLHQGKQGFGRTRKARDHKLHRTRRQHRTF
jgi:hypothetical protein